MWIGCGLRSRRWASPCWWPAILTGFKVHVHNDRPDKVIAYGLSMGTLTRITVENLDAQSHEVREGRAAGAGARSDGHGPRPAGRGQAARRSGDVWGGTRPGRRERQPGRLERLVRFQGFGHRIGAA